MGNVKKGYIIEKSFKGKNEFLKDSKKIIITTYKNSWGEIDSSISVLKRIKQKKDDCFIVGIIESPEMMKHDKLVPVLFSTLREISDIFIYPEIKNNSERIHFKKPNKSTIRIQGYLKYYRAQLRKYFRDSVTNVQVLWDNYQFFKNIIVAYKWSFLFNKDFIDPDNVKVLLEDRTNQTQLQKVLRKKFKNAKVILYPHATSLYPKVRIREEYVVHKPANVLLVYSNLGEEWARKSYPNVDNFFVTGFPRYDRWWINELLNDNNFLNSEEFSVSKKYKKVFTLFSQGVRPAWLKYDDVEYIVKSVADVAMSYDDSLLIIKPHPRQNNEEIRNMMSLFDKNKWMLTNLQPIQASMLADVVISTLSSAMLDALAIGKPVIDFFPNIHFPDAIIDENGKALSDFSYVKLTHPVETRDELSSVIKGYFNGTNKDIWEKQKETAQKILMLDNKSSERAAKIILEYL